MLEAQASNHSKGYQQGETRLLKLFYVQNAAPTEAMKGQVMVVVVCGGERKLQEKCYQKIWMLNLDFSG